MARIVHKRSRYVGAFAMIPQSVIPSESAPLSAGSYEYLPYFGAENNFPDELRDAIFNSPTNHAIIEKKVLYAIGNGVTVRVKNGNAYDVAIANAITSSLNDGRGLADFIRGLIFDQVAYGGHAFEIVRSELGHMATMRHIDWTTIRRGFKKNKETQLTDYFFLVAESWRKNAKTATGDAIKAERIDEFVAGEDSEECSLYYSFAMSSGNTYYPLPSWVGGLKSAQTEAELVNLTYNSARRAFAPSGVLELPAAMLPDQVDKLGRDMREGGIGTQNAGRMFVVQKGEGNDGVKYTAFNEQPFNRDVSSGLNQCELQLIKAHGLPSKTVIGLEGGASLGGDGNTIDTGTRIFMSTVIYPIRRDIGYSIQEAFGAAGLDVELVFEDFDLLKIQGGQLDNVHE